METPSAMTMFAFLRKHQPLTPVSPCLPTTLPHVCDPIPQLPLTPPDADLQSAKAADEESIQTALHVLATERDALTHLKKLYESDPVAQDGFINAVDTVMKMVRRRGKLVVCGVGKSGKIGEKVVATMNSLGIRSAFLHPTEALHGDLGTIAPVSRPSPCVRANTEDPSSGRRHSHDHVFRSDSRAVDVVAPYLAVPPAHRRDIPYQSVHMSALILSTGTIFDPASGSDPPVGDSVVRFAGPDHFHHGGPGHHRCSCPCVGPPASSRPSSHLPCISPRRRHWRQRGPPGSAHGGIHRHRRRLGADVECQPILPEPHRPRDHSDRRSISVVLGPPVSIVDYCSSADSAAGDVERYRLPDPSQRDEIGHHRQGRLDLHSVGELGAGSCRVDPRDAEAGEREGLFEGRDVDGSGGWGEQCQFGSGDRGRGGAG